MSANLLTATIGGTTLSCQLPSAPSVCTPTRRRNQPSDITRGGSLYLYDRGVKSITWQLVHKKVLEAQLNSLLQLADLCHGYEYTLTWYDNASAAHTAKIKGSIKAVETHPGKYQVTFTLEEYL